MAQFDVYKNLNKTSSDLIPYLLDVQAGILEQFESRIVAPLVAQSKLRNLIKNLNPQFEIENKKVVMSTLELTSVPIKILEKKITSLESHRDKIMSAIDFLLFGF